VYLSRVYVIGLPRVEGVSGLPTYPAHSGVVAYLFRCLLVCAVVVRSWWSCLVAFAVDLLLVCGAA
jgi:hypothetical protein